VAFSQKRIGRRVPVARSHGSSSVLWQRWPDFNVNTRIEVSLEAEGVVKLRFKLDLVGIG